MITRKWQNISIVIMEKHIYHNKRNSCVMPKKMPEMQKCVSANMVGIFLKGKGNLWMRRRVNSRVEKPFLSIAFEEALESPTILRRLSSSFQPSYYWNMDRVVDIESFWTEDYAGQIPNRGLWLAILLLWLYRVSHIELYKVNQLWGIEGSIILLNYDA